MLARHDAILNLAALLSRAPGADFEAVGEGLLAPSDDTLEALTLRLEGPLSWHLAVRGTGGDDDFLLEGSVSGTAMQECGRCLTEVATEVSASFIFPTLYRPGVEELTLMDDRDDNEDGSSSGNPPSISPRCSASCSPSSSRSPFCVARTARDSLLTA